MPVRISKLSYHGVTNTNYVCFNISNLVDETIFENVIGEETFAKIHQLALPADGRSMLFTRTTNDHQVNDSQNYGMHTLRLTNIITDYCLADVNLGGFEIVSTQNKIFRDFYDNACIFYSNVTIYHLDFNTKLSVSSNIH